MAYMVYVCKFAMYGRYHDLITKAQVKIEALLSRTKYWESIVLTFFDMLSSQHASGCT